VKGYWPRKAWAASQSDFSLKKMEPPSLMPYVKPLLQNEEENGEMKLRLYWSVPLMRTIGVMRDGDLPARSARILFFINVD